MHAGSPWESLFLSYLGPNQHTLFSVLSNLMMEIFGDSEVAFRLPSMVAGSLAVPLTVLIGKRLTGSIAVGWIAGILMAFFRVEHPLVSGGTWIFSNHLPFLGGNFFYFKRRR